MGQKQIKKMRREQRKILEEVRPIFSQAVKELEGDRDLLDEWIEMVLFLKMNEQGIPITEYLPSKLGFKAKLTIFTPEFSRRNEYTP
ncbi:MAG TPA: hypothetical protein VE954_31080 [Oligoflexus sp.]|uniref:hypothetical protein n=1 Tax=Oligoflexus sp. TaxID=1971216 RepID=UPI002D3E3810|nr:hypothetical protein [Oligoflexus sp.]HYX37568.1 hypothetical protein [Oligoflexus sp.]